MKQLGNLAVICAQRPELLMQLRGLGTGKKPCGDGGRMER
jgi:hypothetical protein